jgi:malate dehydrogenase
MNRKVTVVGGAGNVGATVARAIAVKELADVVIVDIAAEKAAGIALDIFQACPIDGSDTRLIGTSDYAATANSDVVVVTSGVPRKPGMSRDDLLQVNYKIMQACRAGRHSPNCIIVPVANPRRDVPGVTGCGVPARARGRHGGRAHSARCGRSSP